MPGSNQNHDTVIVAVKKEGASPDVIRKIRSFCKKPETRICLVHAIEEKMRFPSLYREILGSFDLSELGRELPDAHEKEARAHLETMKAQLDDQEHIRVQIVHSEDAAASLIAEAQLTRASMIVVEISEHVAQIMPRGLTIPLNLMQHAPMPVLLLRQGAPNNFEKKPHAIIIADDLSASSLGAVRKGMNLATQWGDTHVIHLHVIEQHMHGTLLELAQVSRKIHVHPMGTPELLEHLEHHMETALQRRTLEFQDSLKSMGSTYQTVVQIGHVANKVSAMIRDQKPDLTIFGRRQRLQHGPFGFSRVPFAAVLASSDAVMIVP